MIEKSINPLKDNKNSVFGIVPKRLNNFIQATSI